MKKTQLIFFIRFFIATIFFLLGIFAFTNAFYPIHFFNYQFLPLFERIIIDFSFFALSSFVVLNLITLFFGRFYCSTLCPLGTYQEILCNVFHRKQGSRKNFALKYFLASIVFSLLITGEAYIAKYLDPYTIFGLAISNSLIGIIAFILISILTFFKGRFFCANICPVGTVLGLLSKISLNKIYINKDKCISCKACEKNCPTGSICLKDKSVDNETCIKCLKCIPSCKLNAITYGITSKENIKEISIDKEKRKFLVSAGLLGLSIIVLKKISYTSKKINNKIKNFILPAGGENKDRLLKTCLNCNLCVQRCPMKIIQKADNDFEAIHLDYKNGYCKFDCNRCSKRCPSGALHHISLKEKQNTQIALANIDTSHCIQCGICVKSCPKNAITKKEKEFPRIDEDICIGCGKCAFKCPTKTIKINPIQQQRVLKI